MEAASTKAAATVGVSVRSTSGKEIESTKAGNVCEVEKVAV